MKLIALLLVVLIGCSDKGEHMPTDKGSTPPPQEPQQPSAGAPTQPTQGPTFDKDAKPLFQKYCSNCHKTGSGLPNWLNFQEAHAKRDRIMDRAIVQRNMPPPGNPQLQESEIRLLGEWLKKGAPEGKPAAVATAPTTPANAPSTAPLTIASVPSPAPQVAEEQLPRIYCNESTYFSNGSIKSNRILAANIRDNLFDSVSTTNTTFDTLQKLHGVESFSYFRTIQDRSVEVCGVIINDKDKCLVSNTFSNRSQAKLSIVCDDDYPVHLNFEVKGINASVSCVTPNGQMGGNYTRCELSSFLRR